MMRVSGHLHADGRLRHAFTLVQVLAELRALRALVLRLYELTGEGGLAGVRRAHKGRGRWGNYRRFCGILVTRTLSSGRLVTISIDAGGVRLGGAS